MDAKERGFFRGARLKFIGALYRQDNFQEKSDHRLIPYCVNFT